MFSYLPKFLSSISLVDRSQFLVPRGQTAFVTTGNQNPPGQLSTGQIYSFLANNKKSADCFGALSYLLGL